MVNSPSNKFFAVLLVVAVALAAAAALVSAQQQQADEQVTVSVDLGSSSSKKRPSSPSTCKTGCEGHDGDRPGTYDFYVLSIQWPSTSCIVLSGSDTRKCVPKDVTGFTLHGLWPQQGNTMGPQCCNNNRLFDLQVMQSDAQLAKLMPLYWADLKLGGTGECFYAHEWSKHGTCVGADQNTYLRMALFGMLNMTDPVVALKNGGIVPSDRPVPLRSVMSSLKNAYGSASPYMACSRRGDLFGELRYCLDRNTLKPMQCPPGHDTTGCEDQVKMLPLDEFRQ